MAVAWLQFFAGFSRLFISSVRSAQVIYYTAARDRDSQTLDDLLKSGIIDRAVQSLLWPFEFHSLLPVSRR